MGNMFAQPRRARTTRCRRSIIGSHLDTQPTGGKFDGVLGVLGALEVVRSLNDLEDQDHAVRSRSPTGPTRKARASPRP